MSSKSESDIANLLRTSETGRYDYACGITPLESATKYHPDFVQDFVKHTDDHHGTHRINIFEEGMPLQLIDNPIRHSQALGWYVGDVHEAAFWHTAFFGAGSMYDDNVVGANAETTGYVSACVMAAQEMRTIKEIGGEYYSVKKQSSTVDIFARTLKYVGRYSYAMMPDIHSFEAAQSFDEIDLPLINLAGMEPMLQFLIEQDALDDDVMLGSTDIGGLPRMLHAAKLLRLDVHSDIAICDKKRSTSITDGSDSTNSTISSSGLLYGNPKGRQVVIGDDQFRSVGSAIQAIEQYEALGARDIIIAATHPFFPAGTYYENLEQLLEHPLISRVITTNSLPLGSQCSPSKDLPYVNTPNGVKQLEVVNIAAWLAEKAHIVRNAESIERAVENLGESVHVPQNKYDAFEEVTGMKIEKPIPIGVYLGNIHGDGRKFVRRYTGEVVEVFD